MRAYLAAGSVTLITMSLVLGGGGVPKKEDVPKYLKMLQNGSGKERATAAQMLGKRGALNAGDVKDAIEPLKLMVQKDGDPGARKQAALALGQIGPEPKETVPLLADVIKKDKALEVKLAAVEALTQFGPNAKSALPAIRDFAGQVKDKKVLVQLKAAQKAINAK